MAISNPTMILKFDVVGQNFENIKDRFTKYTMQDACEEASKDKAPVDCVLLVAWPCLQLENGRFLKKGVVVVVPE